MERKIRAQMMIRNIKDGSLGREEFKNLMATAIGEDDRNERHLLLVVAERANESFFQMAQRMMDQS